MRRHDVFNPLRIAQAWMLIVIRIYLRVFHDFTPGPPIRRRDGRPMVIVANHASHLDIAVLFARLPFEEARRTVTAAARDVFWAAWWQPWRWIVPGVVFQIFPFERKNGSQDSLETCRHHVRAGRNVILFPEGRRSRDGGELPFTHGFASVACRTGAVVQPVYLNGVHRACPPGRALPSPVRLTARAADPLDPDGFIPASDRREWYERVRAATVEALRTARGD